MGICAVTSHEKGKKHLLALSNAVGNSKSGKQPLHWLGAPSSLAKLQATTAAAAAHDTGKAGDAATVATSTLLLAESQNKDVLMKSTPEKPTTSNIQHTSSGNFFLKDQVTRAEILWALNGIMCHSSLPGSANCTSLFPLMFPDSEISSRFGMQKDKNSYIVTYGLGPYFQNQLSSTVQKC